MLLFLRYAPLNHLYRRRSAQSAGALLCVPGALSLRGAKKATKYGDDSHRYRYHYQQAY